MFLASENISLRALEPTDLDFLYQLENDVSVWEVSGTTMPFSKYVLQKYLDNAAADIYETRQLRFVIEAKNIGPVGAIDLFDFEPRHMRAGIGISLLPAFRKKSYGSEALEVLIGYSKKYLQLHQLFCSVPVDNVGSLVLFKKYGFAECGRKKEWLQTETGWKDVLDFQLILA